MIERAISLSVVMLLCCPITAEATPPVARVLDVQGTVKILGINGKARPAARFVTVYADEWLEGSDASSSAKLMFKSDGHLECLQGKVKSQATEKGCQPPGIRQDQVPPPIKRSAAKWFADLPETPGGISIARGDSPIVEPISNSRILSAKPVFAWPAKRGVSHYELILSSGTDDSVVWSIKTNATTASYPGEPALNLGDGYYWTVDKFPRNENEDPQVFIAEGSFVLASEAERMQVKELQQLAQSADAAWSLVAAENLMRMHFYAEAIAGYEKLAATSGNDPYFHVVLANLYTIARRHSDSAAAQKRARQLGYKLLND